MGKLYKLIVLLLTLTAMKTSLQAQKVVRSATNSKSNFEIQALNFSNYPNPASTQTLVSFQLDSKAKVQLKVVDLAGKQLALLINADKLAGKHELEWNFATHNIKPGMYILMLQVDNKMYSRKVIVQ